MLTLYHGRTSVCSIKARLALAEKGLAFESHVLTLRGDQFDPAYMKLNPNAVVPTLIHDGSVILEFVMPGLDEVSVGNALRRRRAQGCFFSPMSLMMPER